MLKPMCDPALRDQDQQVFDTLAPADHCLRHVLRVVDFERYRATMAVRCFWRSVISDYTEGRFNEQELANDDWTEPVFWFANRPG